MIKRILKNIAREFGYLVAAYDARRDPLAIRRALFERRNVDLVFDVGANTGQFATELRSNGFKGNIVSFEPMSAAFNELNQTSRQDDHWLVRQCALGEHEGKSEINIAGNSWSSSLLDMADTHTATAPESAYVGKEEIDIQRLDRLYLEYSDIGNRPFLKIDTQGYTKEVLAGAKDILCHIQGVLVEMSLVELYVNEPLIGEVTSMLYKEGFVLVGIEPELFDTRTGQLLQVNGLFERSQGKANNTLI